MTWPILAVCGLLALLAYESWLAHARAWRRLDIEIEECKARAAESQAAALRMRIENEVVTGLLSLLHPETGPRSGDEWRDAVCVILRRWVSTPTTDGENHDAT